MDFNTFFKGEFGEKIIKLSLDGGATCPNRDGTISHSGCIFCSERGSGDFTSDFANIDMQIEAQKNLLKKKWNAKKYIAYFQNFTNTYGDVNYLKNLYGHIIARDEIVGLSIATRADCLDDKIMEILKDLNDKTFLFLEIGLQSIHEKSIGFIKRGYSHEVFRENIKKLEKNNIKYLVHVIFGLPGETREEMLATVKYVAQLHPFGVKFHSLYIQSDAPLYEYYKNTPFELLSKEEYVHLVCDAIEILPRDIVIHRVTGDANKQKLIAPLWSADKLSVIASIDRELKNRNIDIIE